jgi:hypothetical protein
MTTRSGACSSISGRRRASTRPASASTVDLRLLVPGPLTPKDDLWNHEPKSWLFNMGMLAVISLFYIGFVRWRIRLKGS